MFWNWSHFFLHQIWLLAILEFHPWAVHSRAGHKQYQGSWRGSTALRARITLSQHSSETEQWGVEDVEREREREREGRSLSVVSSQCASQYAQCWAGWLCCAVCLSSSAPAPSQVSNVTPTLTEWRRRCVRRREDTELASSNTTRVSNGSRRRNLFNLLKWKYV